MELPYTSHDSNAVQYGIANTLFSQARWSAIARDLRLSQRERQIVQLIFDGHKEASIARELGISVHTVHSHIGRLHRKLNVRDRCELLLRIFETYMSLESGGSASAMQPRHRVLPPIQASPE